MAHGPVPSSVVASAYGAALETVSEDPRSRYASDSDDTLAVVFSVEHTGSLIRCSASAMLDRIEHEVLVIDATHRDIAAQACVAAVVTSAVERALD
jgi:hypothetical protein